MSEEDQPCTVKYLEKNYFLLKKSKYWQILGGALVFPVVIGVISYKASVEAIGKSAASNSVNRIEELTVEAENSATRLKKLVELDSNYRWALNHTAAIAACAATSPVGDSIKHRIAIPKKRGRSCADSCSYETDGNYINCSTSIAVGNILDEKVSKYGERIGNYYNYGCSDAQDGYDEVAEHNIQTYSAYCCCHE